MPRDTQIFSGADHAGHSDYLLPGNSEIRVLAVNANFEDNGAAVDWCPAVVMFSDSGHVIARAVNKDDPVTAGDDAEASFFPGVKPGGGSAASLTWRTQRAYTTIGQVIPSGAATTITFDAGSIFNATSRPLIGNGGSPATITSVFDYEVSIGLVVQWPAGAYDRYIEIVDPSFDTSGAPINWRARGSVTPDADIQTVFAIFTGNEFAPRTIQLNCFQASGVNKTIQRWLVASTIPYLRPPGINQ